MFGRKLGLVCSLAVGLAPGLAPVARAQAPTIAELSQLQGADREARLAAGAKKEGEVFLYTSMQSDSTAILRSAFEGKYGVKVKIWRGGSEQILWRTITEARAGRFELDIVESDGVMLEALVREGVLAPLPTPHTADLIPQAVRAHGQWLATRVNVFSGVYNTKLVDKAEVPKSYKDLTDPRWKGRLAVEQEDTDWFSAVVTQMGEAEGIALFRRIFELNGVSLRKGHTLLTNLVASGEVPLALTVYMQNVDTAKKAGGPVEGVLLPPVIARPNGTGVTRRAPHPHAALLLADFLLSEWQALMLKRDYVPTNRKVPSTLTGIDVTFADPAALLDHEQKWRNLFRDVTKSVSRK